MPEGLFTDRDLRQMTAMGLAPEEAARQVELFRHPPPHTRVLRPCQPGDGIRSIPPAGHAPLAARFDAATQRGGIGKLIPASGAATRMFQDLLAYMASPADAEIPPTVQTFFDNLDRFAFRKGRARPR
jgi:Domain of unknown function (DUF4301)